MPKGKWTRRVPNGKLIDSLIKKQMSRQAVEVMRQTERQLIMDRKQITSLMHSMPQGSVQQKRYSFQIERINRRLSEISDFLRK